MKIAERNLTALWSNYAELGYRRLISTHTVSVLAENEAMFQRAVGADVRIVRVATDGRSVIDIAREVLGATTWLLPSTSA